MQQVTALAHDEAIAGAWTFEGRVVEVLVLSADDDLEVGFAGCSCGSVFEGAPGAALELSTGRLVMDRGAFDGAEWVQYAGGPALRVELQDGRAVEITERQLSARA